MAEPAEQSKPEQTATAGLRDAVGLVLALRLIYSGLAALLVPYLRLDQTVIRSNHLTENLLQPADGWIYRLWGVWERFDTLWYIRIAERGYDRVEALVFFPLYPALIRLLTPVTGGPLPAALVISTLASVALFWGFQKLLLLDFPRNDVRMALLLYAAWPTSFMLLAGYPDSLVTGLVVWSIYFARTDRWWLAGVTGFFAGTAKALGYVVAAPLAVLAWRKRTPQALPGSLTLLAPMIIIGFTRFYAHTSSSEIYRLYWRTEVAFPLDTLVSAVSHAFGNATVWDRMNLATLVIISIASLLKPWRMEYVAYSLLAVTMFLLKKTEPILQSTMRYLLAVFPAYLLLAINLQDRLFVAALGFVGMMINLKLFWLFLDWNLVV